MVRTDRRRLRPLANQLRAHLQIVFPAAVGLFADLDSEISLRFLDRFTTQQRAGWLSIKRWTAWLASVGYSGRVRAARLHAEIGDASTRTSRRWVATGQLAARPGAGDVPTAGEPGRSLPRVRQSSSLSST